MYAEPTPDSAFLRFIFPFASFHLVLRSRGQVYGREPPHRLDCRAADLEMDESLQDEANSAGRVDHAASGAINFDERQRHAEPEFADDGRLVVGARCRAHTRDRADDID